MVINITSKCAKCERSIGGVFDTIHWETYNNKKYCASCLPIIKKIEPKKQKILDKESDEEANLKWYFKLSRNIYKGLFYLALISLYGLPFSDVNGIVYDWDIFSLPIFEFIIVFFVFAVIWFFILLLPFIFGYYIPNKQLKKNKENREEILGFILIPCLMVLIPLFFRISWDLGLSRLESFLFMVGLLFIYILWNWRRNRKNLKSEG